MRILFCTLAQKTHFLTMTGLAWAIRSAGHEVRVACPDDFSETVVQAGLTAQPVGPSALHEESAEEREESRRGLPDPYGIAEREPDPADLPDILEQLASFVTYGYAIQNFPVVRGMVDFARAWKPDLVLWEPFTFAGAIAARACGAPHGRLLFTVDVLGATHEWIGRHAGTEPADQPLAAWLAALAKRFGTTYHPDLISGQFTIEQGPTSLQSQTELVRHPVQYVPYGGAAVVPKWLRTPPTRRRVGITLGLSAVEHFNGYTVDVADIVTEIAALDVEVVVTVAKDHQHRLGPVPENVRVVDYVPLEALAPTCDVVVHHGGFGTLSTVARFGVPQLVMPYHFEGPLLTSRLTALGAAIEVHSDEASGKAVARSVQALLTDPRHRRAAQALREEIAAVPTAAEFAAGLTDLVADHAPGLVGAGAGAGA